MKSIQKLLWFDRAILYLLNLMMKNWSYSLYDLFKFCFSSNLSLLQVPGGKHKAQRPNQGLHLVLSGLAPCFYLAVLSSLPLVQEQLHLYSPKIKLGPLKATARLMWLLVKMSLTPLPIRYRRIGIWQIGGGRNFQTDSVFHYGWFEERCFMQSCIQM